MAGIQRTRPYHAAAAGATSIAQAEITVSDAAARVLICTLPPNSVLLDSWVEVVTAFNAGTSNTLTVGTGVIGAAEADDIVATVTEGTPGVYNGVGAGAPLAVVAAATDVYLYYTPGATGGTTGKAWGFVHYARLAENG